MNIFVERLNQLLLENHVTRFKLAKDLGVNKQTVIFWANGTNEPKISYLKALAEYFNVSADYLLGINDFE